MKEFRYSKWMVLNYVPLMLFLGVLIYLGTYIENFKWIIMSLPIGISVISIVYFIIQIRMLHIVEDDSIKVVYSEKRSHVISYLDITGITLNKRSLEVTYKRKHKIKTHYISAKLKDYDLFLEIFREGLLKSSNYDEINFI